MIRDEIRNDYAVGDDDDTDFYADAPVAGNQCKAMHGEYQCTRGLGHAGNHASGARRPGAKYEIRHVWTDDELDDELPFDAEVEAIRIAVAVLEPLDIKSAERVLGYLCGRLYYDREGEK